MKVILSRKGFDSRYGGCASPVISKKTMLSFPIPFPKDPMPLENSPSHIKYQDLKYHGTSYESMIKSLSQRELQREYCHLDPDIRKDIRDVPSSWQAAFGQCKAAQGHLQHQNIEIGDLFLFFGWFCFAEWVDNQLKYDHVSSSKHMIYGYLQIGKKVDGEEVKKYYWHPHSNIEEEDYKRKNMIYVASESLTINGRDTGLKGYGTFRYSEDLVLTKGSYSRSKWKKPSWLEDDDIHISYHSKKSIKDDYFQSARIGQEFVISENSKVTEWAESLILNNIDLDEQ